jgi:hypothetical protein
VLIPTEIATAALITITAVKHLDVLKVIFIKKVARFIQSRFRKLEVSEVRYEDLLSEAYSHYLKYLKLT